jgi:cation/acetate symporter
VLAGFAFASALGAGALVLLAGLGVSNDWIDGGYWALGIALAAAAAVGAGMKRSYGVSPLFGGLAMATDGVSGAFYLALAGMIFAWGHDGLAFALGLGAGSLLLQLLIAPRLASTGATSLPGLFAARFPGQAPRLLCAAVVIVSMLLLLAAELMAGGLVGARLLGVPHATGAIIAACAVLACFVVRGPHGASWANGLLFPVMLVAILVPLVHISASWYGLPVPQLAYANALWQIQGVEETLLEQDLADPAVMRPMLTPFLVLTPINFIGIVLGLAAGVAALPSLVSAHLIAMPARAARWSAVWALVFVAVFLGLAPAAAAYFKLPFLTLIGDHTTAANLPEWVYTYGRLGLVEVCGRAATDAAAVAQACSALADAGPSLRVQDIALSPDMILLALPDVAGLDHAMLGIVAAAALGAAIVTANGPLSAMVRALGLKTRAMSGEIAPRRQRLVSYTVAVAILVAATAVAVARPAGILEVVALSFVLAAAGLFPALFGALWWKRANSYGAAAAVAVGSGVAIAYLVGTRLLAVPFVAALSTLSGPGQSGQEYLSELRDAWLAAQTGAAKEAAWQALNQQAQSMADLWGISGLAVALLALPAGFLALVAVSLATPRGVAPTAP